MTTSVGRRYAHHTIRDRAGEGQLLSYGRPQRRFQPALHPCFVAGFASDSLGSVPEVRVPPRVPRRRILSDFPSMGPLLIVANHQSNIDPPLLGASIPRRIWFLAKDGIFANFAARWFLESYGAHPLNRGSFDPAALKWLLRKLDTGGVVALFPEGTRSKGKGMQKAMPGVARIALRSQIPEVDR